MNKWDLYQVYKTGSTFEKKSHCKTHQQANEENSYSISIDAENAFDKNPTSTQD